MNKETKKTREILKYGEKTISPQKNLVKENVSEERM